VKSPERYMVGNIGYPLGQLQAKVYYPFA